MLLFRKHSINLHEAFRGFDRDGDGVISPAEFRRGLQSLSLDLTSQQITDLVSHMDRDRDGHVDLAEFRRQFGQVAVPPRGQGFSDPRPRPTVGDRSSLTMEVVRELQRVFEHHGVNLDEAFRAFDDNGDGLVSPVELSRGLRSLNLGLSSRQIEAVIAHMDRDGDGHVSLKDFKRKFQTVARPHWPAEGSGRSSVQQLQTVFRTHRVDLETAFRAFDRNGDGVISPAEFRRGLQSLSLDLTSQQIADLVSHMDRDGDGHVDLADFRRQFATRSGGGSTWTQGALRLEHPHPGAHHSTRILGRHTAPFTPFLIPNRAPHGFTPRS